MRGNDTKQTEKVMKKVCQLALISFLLVLTGCATSRDLLYFQDIDEVSLGQLAKHYELVIKRDDELKIIVSGPDKSVTDPYNMTLADITSGFTTHNEPETPMMSFVVDTNGDINFPVLGRIHVEGMTRLQLIDYLTEEIGKDVKNPIVYVSFKNYKITVLGEVNSPGTYTYKTERINVLQALGLAGDLTVAAKRDRILLLREVDGVMQHYALDLRESSLLDSPYFYLQQNDIIYVPPSSTRLMTKNNGPSVWGAVLSSISTVIAIISLLK